jgi:GNAT superfamily N-acetyltransferase
MDRVTSIKVKSINFINKIIRYYNSIQRPSKKHNLKLLSERGETLDSIIIREVSPEDILSLARLHVKTWNETYHVRRPPTYQLRESQWRDQFKITDGNWFCFVVQNDKKEFIGFAKGTRNDDHSGNLDKIYLLREYQRLGIGSRLLGHVTRRFIRMGVSHMILFGIPQNPSCAFHETLGGERIFALNGEFHGGYIWTDLPKLAASCPLD